MKALLILAALVPCLSSPRACADLIAEGHHYIDHDIYFEGMDRFPQLTFVLYPVSWGSGNGWEEIPKGKCLHWYKFSDPRVYAFPRGGELPGSTAFFRHPDVLNSELEIHRFDVVPVGSPVVRKRTIYRITGIEGAEIKVEPGLEEQFDASGKVLHLVPTPILKAYSPAPYKAFNPAVEKVPFENSPGHFWAMGGVSVLGLLVLFKLRKSAAASKSPEA